eukprot:COSAG01_NODE_43105_length_430_cov_0.865269_1_plen_58_part_01
MFAEAAREARDAQAATEWRAEREADTAKESAERSLSAAVQRLTAESAAAAESAEVRER